MIMSDVWSPVWLTFKLASVTTIILLLIGIPMAWWLAKSEGKLKTLIEVIVALPIVLPPTVLGFYLLLALSPTGAVGGVWALFSQKQLIFSFYGLLIGSVIYSMPFVVQPLTAGFKQFDRDLLKVAARLGATPWTQFTKVLLPMCSHSFKVAIALGFAHTIGEFGVILMIGGNIPGETSVLSIAIYEQVEMGNYQQAHLYAIGLLIASFSTLWLIYRKGGYWMNFSQKQNR